MEAVEGVGEGDGGGDWTAKVDDGTTQDKDNPMGRVVRSKTHHEQSDDHADQRADEQPQLVLGLRDPVVLFGESNGAVICQPASKHRSTRVSGRDSRGKFQTHPGMLKIKGPRKVRPTELGEKL